MGDKETVDTRHDLPTANAHVCPGCGEEYDPRAEDRGMNTTESGYCGLMCALADADGEYDDE